MKAVNFPLRMGETRPVPAAGHETIWIPNYPLDGIMYGPEADPDGEGKRDAAGPLPSCGEFIRLSKACKLGRELLSTNQWPSHFTRVVYSSTLVDVAANIHLLRETAVACNLIFSR